MNITADRGSVHAVSRLVPAGDQPLPAAMEAIAPTEKQLNEWLDTPVGRLDTPLPGGAPLALAANGSLLANFFNQVQLAVSGADISVTSLSNQVADFPQDVTIRANHLRLRLPEHPQNHPRNKNGFKIRLGAQHGVL